VIVLRLFVCAVFEDRDRQCLEVNIGAVGSPSDRDADKTSGCPIAFRNGPFVHKTISPRRTTASVDASGHSISRKHSVSSSIAIPAAPVLLRASLPQRRILLPIRLLARRAAGRHPFEFISVSNLDRSVTDPTRRQT
jgi:hypothetical protein